jgi:hypothetical protein
MVRKKGEKKGARKKLLTLKHADLKNHIDRDLHDSPASALV